MSLRCIWRSPVAMWCNERNAHATSKELLVLTKFLSVAVGLFKNEMYPNKPGGPVGVWYLDAAVCNCGNDSTHFFIPAFLEYVPLKIVCFSHSLQNSRRVRGLQGARVV